MVRVSKVDVLACILLYLATIANSYDSCFYPTAFDKGWLRKCPDDTFVSHLVSSYATKFHDRMWMVCCRKLPKFAERSSCSSWTDYENKLGSALQFRCPAGRYLGGMASWHSDDLEDRRYKFRCCNSPQMRLRRCRDTELLNEFHGILNYNVTAGRVITGMRGTFCAHNRDRKFKLTTCQYKKKKKNEDA